MSERKVSEKSVPQPDTVIVISLMLLPVCHLRCFLINLLDIIFCGNSFEKSENEQELAATKPSTPSPTLLQTIYPPIHRVNAINI